MLAMLSEYKISSDNNIFPICYISFSYKLVPDVLPIGVFNLYSTTEIVT